MVEIKYFYLGAATVKMSASFIEQTVTILFAGYLKEFILQNFLDEIAM